MKDLIKFRHFIGALVLVFVTSGCGEFNIGNANVTVPLQTPNNESINQESCTLGDVNCDGIDDIKPGQPNWDPYEDYDGDGISNINEIDVDNNGIPNGLDFASDPYEFGGLKTWGCPPLGSPNAPEQCR
jgi:hypothetical protein